MVEQFRNELEYKEGLLLWKKDQNNQIKAGMEAGKVDTSGYKRFVFQGKRYLVHRIVFLLHHGFLPKYVDHVNRNKLDNSIGNLREVSASESRWNTAGSKGLPKHVFAKGPSYYVAIWHDKKLLRFGTYSTVEQAESVAKQKITELRGEAFSIEETFSAA